MGRPATYYGLSDELAFIKNLNNIMWYDPPMTVGRWNPVGQNWDEDKDHSEKLKRYIIETISKLCELKDIELLLELYNQDYKENLITNNQAILNLWFDYRENKIDLKEYIKRICLASSCTTLFSIHSRARRKCSFPATCRLPRAMRCTDSSANRSPT